MGQVLAVKQWWEVGEQTFGDGRVVGYGGLPLLGPALAARAARQSRRGTPTSIAMTIPRLDLSTLYVADHAIVLLARGVPRHNVSPWAGYWATERANVVSVTKAPRTAVARRVRIGFNDGSSTTLMVIGASAVRYLCGELTATQPGRP